MNAIVPRSARMLGISGFIEVFQQCGNNTRAAEGITLNQRMPLPCFIFHFLKGHNYIELTQ
jgi:hypothetical protein